MLRPKKTSIAACTCYLVVVKVGKVEVLTRGLSEVAPRPELSSVYYALRQPSHIQDAQKISDNNVYDFQVWLRDSIETQAPLEVAGRKWNANYYYVCNIAGYLPLQHRVGSPFIQECDNLLWIDKLWCKLVYSAPGVSYIHHKPYHEPIMQELIGHNK